MEETFLSAQYCSDAALRCRRLFLGNSLFPSSLRRRSKFPCSAQPSWGKSADDKSAGRCLWLLREVSSCRSRATWLRYTRTFLRSISTCAMPQRFGPFSSLNFFSFGLFASFYGSFLYLLYHNFYGYSLYSWIGCPYCITQMKFAAVMDCFLKGSCTFEL